MFIIKLLYNGILDKNDAKRKRKIILINTLTYVGIIHTLLMGTYTYLFVNTTVGSLNYAICGILICGQIFLYYTKKLNIVIYFTTSALSFFLVYLFITGGISKTGHLWLFMLPPISHYLLGKNRGSIATSITFIPILFLLLNKEWNFAYPYETAFLWRYIFAYSMVWILSWTFENIREKQQAKIEERINKYKTAINKLNLTQEALVRESTFLEQQITEYNFEINEKTELLEKETQLLEEKRKKLRKV